LVLLVALCAGALCACDTQRPYTQAGALDDHDQLNLVEMGPPAPGQPAAPVRSSASVIRSVEGWNFDGTQGQHVKTDHFSFFITAKAPVIAERLPGFAEAALTHYTTAIAPLSMPDQRLETFLMASRQQWQSVALQVVGPRVTPFTAIRRGGFATMGRAFYFDIGAYDTLAVAAHEGWHQYTQRSFLETMPVWLEEGVATYMEGHKWDGGTPRFLPWANIERFDRLREVVATGELMNLTDLMAASPDQFVANGGGSGRGITYYAQLWALMHFLNEGQGGKHREGLQRAVADAASGKMSKAIVTKLGNAQGARMLARQLGPTVFRTYFSDDLASANAEYMAFVRQIVAPGGREAIVAGTSPVTPPATNATAK
jgi:hypothetical protein